MHNQWTSFVVLTAVLLAMAMPSNASAEFITVYGGPAIELTTHPWHSPFRPIDYGSRGLILGYRNIYVDGAYSGSRALLWGQGGASDPLQLGNLGDSVSGITEYEPAEVSISGIVVGTVWVYDPTSEQSAAVRAVYWKADGSIVDLNTLIDPSSGWTLTSCDSISDIGWETLVNSAIDWRLIGCEALCDTDWIAGYGMFDPDGCGPLVPVLRPFLLNVSSIVPEPASLFLLAAAGLTTRRRRRHLLTARPPHLMNGRTSMSNSPSIFREICSLRTDRSRN